MEEDFWFDSVVAEKCDVPVASAAQVKNLLKEGCTVPFICRYRVAEIGGLQPAQVRDINERVEELEQVRAKAKSVRATNEATLEKLLSLAEGRLTLPKVERLSLESSVVPPAVLRAVDRCTTMEDVNELVEPYASRKKGRTELALELGLEKAALILLNGTGARLCVFRTLRREFPAVEENYTPHEAREILLDMLASFMSRDPETHEQVDVLLKQFPPWLRSGPASEKGDRAAGDNFETYFEFRCRRNDLKPYQVLAIDRGEERKVLTVSVEQSTLFVTTLENWLYHKFESLNASEPSPESNPFIRNLLKTAVQIAIKKFILPSAKRKTRSELTNLARKDALKVFRRNLRSLLLAIPLNVGETGCVLALDPGYAAIKCAMVDCDGRLLQNILKIVRLFEKRPHGQHMVSPGGRRQLSELLRHPDLRVVAIGDGQAARETEQVVASIRSEMGAPEMGDEGGLWRFTTVSEAGVSVWSSTAAADEEFGTLAPGYRSAISLARRLLDPLGEYTKVEPQSLGVGMYQHDIPKNELKKALTAETQESVSNAGVNLNAAPVHLLAYVSGLGPARAKSLVQYREEKGRFRCRAEILSVKGIGPKTFEQCAGFLRIPDGNEPLDRTWIHPELYESARLLIRMTMMPADWIGTDPFVKALDTVMRGEMTSSLLQYLQLNSPEQLNLILTGLRSPQGQLSVHEGMVPPLLRDKILFLKDLSLGMRLTGRVSNITPFGAFVDIGVEVHGLLHRTRIPTDSLLGLNVGHVMEVEIERIELDREKPRVGLRWCKVNN